MIFSKLQQKILIKNCIAGKSFAQKKLYDTYSDEMFKVCLIYATDYDYANDLLQEGFLKVFQNIHKFKNNGSLGGWIRTVLVNNCIDHIRSDKWSDKVTKVESFNCNENIISINNAEKQFREDDFLSLIKDLPKGYRTILNLYFLEDYNHKEIAQKLNITEGTSKSQLFKAKKYLKNILVSTLSEDEISKYVRLDKKVV